MRKVIPFHTRYTITENGDVTNENGESVAEHLNDAGYRVLRINRDDGKNYIARVHRLCILAYGIDNPDWEMSLVNHIDGNKLNCHYKNLEYATHQENNAHAYRMGLNKNGLAFIAFCQKTLTEHYCNNTVHGSTVTGIPQGQLYEALRSSPVSDCGRWVFKSPDDIRSWDEIIDNPEYAVGIKRYRSVSDDIVVLNHVTGEQSVFTNINQVVSHTKLNKAGIVSRLSSGSNYPIGNYSVALEQDSANLIRIPLELLLHFPKSKAKWSIVYKDGVRVGLVRNWKDFAVYAGREARDLGNILDVIKNRGSFNGLTISEIVEVKLCELLELLLELPVLQRESKD